MSASHHDPLRQGLGFTPETGAMLLAGRLVRVQGGLHRMLNVWDRFSDIAAGCEVVLAHDLSCGADWDGDDDLLFSLTVGVPIARSRAAEGPSAAFSETAIERSLAEARRRLSAQTLSRLAAELEPFEATALLAQTHRVWLVPYGPIASAALAYGVIADRDAPVHPGASRIAGRAPTSEPQPRCVHGHIVATAHIWDVVAPKLPRALAPDEKPLHLIASYDDSGLPSFPSAGSPRRRR